MNVEFDDYEDQENLITNEDDWRWGAHPGASTSAVADEEEAQKAAAASAAATAAEKAAERARKEREAERAAERAADAALKAAELAADEAAAARKPEGALVVRGLLVPSGAEADVTQWQYMETGVLLGWALQHAGRHRRTSLWVRTARAWYWLRDSPPFVPATIFRKHWHPPGSDVHCPLAEPLLLASPELPTQHHVRATELSCHTQSQTVTRCLRTT